VLWLRYTTVLVHDCDEALAFYAGVLGYEVVDERDGGTAGTVRLTPHDGGGAGLLLMRAGDANERIRVGSQAGGRSLLRAETDDLAREHARLVARGVRFVEAPRDDERGRIAVFEDPYGNRIDLVEPARTC
jgi:predicted enzyme related to lactoylglutathione lyase